MMIRRPSQPELVQADQAMAVIGAGTDVREGRLDAETWAVESVLVPLAAVEDELEVETLVEQLVAAFEP